MTTKFKKRQGTQPIDDLLKYGMDILEQMQKLERQVEQQGKAIKKEDEYR